MSKSYYQYWGKAFPTDEQHPQYHLLPYHCLDVAAVARCWWEASQSLRQQFTKVMQADEEQAKAWVLFFVALHDYGKFDVRFQRKAPKTHQQVQPDFDKDLIDIGGFTIKKYAHGEAGFSLFYRDFQADFGWNEYEVDLWEQWQPYLAAVMGHHGALPSKPDYPILVKDIDADSSIINFDLSARRQWVLALENLFLAPAQLSLQSPLPNFQQLITGFCSVCDWLGSKAEDNYFTYQSTTITESSDDIEDLKIYFEKRLVIANKLIQESGLLGEVKKYSSVQALLDKKNSPRQLQTLVDSLPLKTGLTLIEAPTGSGKTEAALAYAWRLLDKQLAGSIVFALPTQATSNAMFDRLIQMASVLFGDNPNAVLAHGKANFNDTFWQLKQTANRITVQSEDKEKEANIQCSQWLGSSRKRVFLGQIGVCTVDQVLVSVLPVKHNFVRGFGLGKSVLIVDEVHAYDLYMMGLLHEVIAQQKQSGGSVILLSATLPSCQKQVLLKAWDYLESLNEQAQYPLITHCDSENQMTAFVLAKNQMPHSYSVAVETVAIPELLPDDSIKEAMLKAAKQGAQVVFICNLVDVAQKLADDLRQLVKDLPETERVAIALFHARYRFCDRQDKEKNVLDWFGKEGHRETGRILIATQVVEQSLDLDFDWMLTQLCPVDLLFQRLGRLHRHKRDNRPEGFEDPRCTVLIPDNEDYGLHKVIYGNSRVLWRTAQLLQDSGGSIEFPKTYRDWIDKVYERDDWENEPEKVSLDYDEFQIIENGKFKQAKQLTYQEISEFADTDVNVSSLTRDGEMSLNVLPVMETKQERQLLDGQVLEKIDKWFKDEEINKNIVSVPQSWRKFFPESKDGLVYLVMQKTEEESWQAEFDKWTVFYSKQLGLIRKEK